MSRFHLAAALSISLIFVGAGCQKSTPRASTTPTSTASATEAASARVSVPELGFSYVPVSDDPTVYGSAEQKGTRLEFGSDGLEFIEFIPKSTGQTMMQALQDFLIAHGGNPSECTLEKDATLAGTWDWLPAGLEQITFVPKTKHVPTTAEIYADLRASYYPNATNASLANVCEKTPACDLAKEAIVQRYNEKQCGAYSIRTAYQSVSVFLKNPKNDSSLYYIRTAGGGSRPAFDGGLIEFLP